MQDSTVDFKRLVQDIKQVRNSETVVGYLPTAAEAQVSLLIHETLTDEEFDYYVRIYSDHCPDDPWIDEILMERYEHNREGLAAWARGEELSTGEGDYEKEE